MIAVLIDPLNGSPWARAMCQKHGNSFAQYIINSFSTITYQFTRLAKASTLNNTVPQAKEIRSIISCAHQTGHAWTNAAFTSSEPPSFTGALVPPKHPAYAENPDFQRRTAPRLSHKNDNNSTPPQRNDPPGTFWSGNQ